MPPFLSGNNFMKTIGYIIDFLFFLDILFTFKTSFINLKNGDEVTNPREIFINYLKGRFYVDLIATIPFDVIFSSFNLTLSA